MAKRFSTYWYQEDDQFRSAFLFNCRDADITEGGTIPKGAVVQGAVGYCVAEAPVAGYSGDIVAFKPNRRCVWRGIELRCLCHPMAPASAKTKKELRGFNYVVADLSAPEARSLAEELQLPVVVADGLHLANLELDVFQGQGRGSVRRARLI
jgi:hypothetical protein